MPSVVLGGPPRPAVSRRPADSPIAFLINVEVARLTPSDHSPFGPALTTRPRIIRPDT